jgi:signal transduction histidine kinase
LEQTLIELKVTQSQLTDMAHSAGMAEIATGVLHNVGNLLNSVNVSVAMVTGQLRNSKIVELERLIARLDAQDHHLADFLAAEDRADKLLEYLHKLSDLLREEQQHIAAEVGQMTVKVDNVKGVIAAQQSYARAVSFREDVDLEKLINDVLAMHAPSFLRHSVEVVTELEPLPPVWIEKNKIVQLLDNLIRNAVESIRDAESDVRRITVSLREFNDDEVRLTVADTGGGIEAGQLEQIFNYGFTTKPAGNGFGLHSAALAANSLGGKVVASSEGIGKGAVFTLDLPAANEEQGSRELAGCSRNTSVWLLNEEKL